MYIFTKVIISVSDYFVKGVNRLKIYFKLISLPSLLILPKAIFSQCGDLCVFNGTVQQPKPKTLLIASLWPIKKNVQTLANQSKLSKRV